MTMLGKYSKICTMIGVILILVGKGKDFMSITGAILIFTAIAVGFINTMIISRRVDKKKLEEINRTG
jgi:TctA family transporter